jgi:Serpentine type 7TM GPCR chemoreceptor Srv
LKKHWALKAMDKIKTIKSEPPSPDTKSWYDYIYKAEQETPNRIEDAAKFLATMISVSLSIFLAIGKSTFENYTGSFPIRLSVVVWIASLLLSFVVLFPQKYRYSGESVESIKEMHRKIIRRKRFLLTASFLLFLTALCTLAYQFFLKPLSL